MKQRNGFVSNSSSSSFIIKPDGLSKLQIYAIKNHIEIANKALEWDVHEGEAWKISERNGDILLLTNMDNFDMRYFLQEIEIPAENIDGERY